MYHLLASSRLIQAKGAAPIPAKEYHSKLHFYEKPRRIGAVYNTHADKGRLHFDVFIPTDKSQSIQVPKEIDSEAVEYAKEFLTLIGKPSEDIAVNMWERCHIDNTDLYASYGGYVSVSKLHKQ